MANINRDKPTINKMSEEDTGIEKQIINILVPLIIHSQPKNNLIPFKVL